MRTKNFTLISGTEDRWLWYVRIQIREKSENKFYLDRGTAFYFRNQRPENNKYRQKIKQRHIDLNWVKQNIPSSIWWHTQIHHDWKDGGRMYLLTKGEHILRHRRET